MQLWKSTLTITMFAILVGVINMATAHPGVEYIIQQASELGFEDLADIGDAEKKGIEPVITYNGDRYYVDIENSKLSEDVPNITELLAQLGKRFCNGIECILPNEENDDHKFAFSEGLSSNTEFVYLKRYSIESREQIIHTSTWKLVLRKL